MKKAKFLLLTLLSVLGMNTAWAETVSPYEVDFNTAITTSVHNFAVASNWGHIVPASDYDGYGPYYMSYTYSSNEGIEGSGALICYRQYAGDYAGGEVIKDILVTPKVNGTITMYVKPNSTSSSNPSFVEIYDLNEAGTAIVGNYTNRFTEEEGFVADETNEGWYTITFTQSEAKRIGIRAQYVVLDNFSASSADIVLQKVLSITGLTKAESGSGAYMPYQNEDGTVDISLKVKLKNSGDVDLKAGDDNYTLTLVKKEYYNSNTTEFDEATFAIDQDIAVGETAEFEANFTAPSSLGTGWMYLKVKENISGSISSAQVQTQVLEYASKFAFNKAGTTYPSNPTDITSTSTPIAFGKVTEAVTVNYEIYNPGRAPLTINSLTIDAPFTTNAPAGEFTVAGGEKKVIDITFPAAEPGIFNGTLTIEYTNFGKEAATYTLGVSATLVDPSKNLITFDNGKTGDEFNGQYPAGSIHPNVYYITTITENEETNYVLTGAYDPKNKKFITPMLTATTGETFSFDAWQGGNGSYVVVYTSKDRTNWTELKRVTSSELYSTARTFSATIEEAGDYYLGFELINGSKIDDIYGLTLKDLPEHDWYVMDSNLPTTGKQNNPYTATISVKNINAEADAIATATLYVGGEAVAVEENVTLEGNDKTAAEGTGVQNNVENPVEITLTFNPHTTGELAAYIELKTGDNVLLTEEVTVNIAEEVAESELAIGEEKTTSTYVPFYGTWADDGQGLSECDVLYNAEVLTTFGLKEGDKITAINFKGTPSSNKTFNSLTTDAWVGLEDAEAAFVAGSADKDNMQHVVLHNGETVNFTDGETMDFTITLTEPIVWDGVSSIRLATNMNGHGSYINIKFPADNNYSSAFYSHGGGSWSSTYSPVAYLSLSMEEKTLSGTVTDEVTGEPIEGATVTIRNEENDVEYTATTDAEGKYTINVVQDKLTYTATVEAEGYVTEEDDEVLSFEEGSLEYDFTLYPENPVYPTVTVTISDSEYATLYYEDTYLGIPDDVKAYTAKVDGKNIVLTEVTDYIPAGKPVIINGPQGEYEFEVLPMAAPEAGGAIFSEIGLFENGVTYNSGATIGEESVTVELGNDRTTKPYDVKLGTAKAYCANIFGQIVDVENENGEIEQKTRVVYVTGNQNPKDGELNGDTSTGNGYKPENKNLPQSGCYYMITPNTAGHITAYIILNSNKNFYVVKGSDGECLPVSALTLKADGETPTDVTLKDDYTIDAKLTGTVEFDVEADETYYMFATGSKLCFGGYLFVSSDEEDDPDNDLIGTEEDITITNDAAYKYYVLSWKDANKNKDELGFYFWSGSNDGHSMQLGAHKAYIKKSADEGSNKGYMFWLPDAIEGITMDALTNADAIYTLSGIRVNANNLKKGIYIVNGKKVVIK